MTELTAPSIRAGHMQEILDLLSINDSRLLGDPAAFWQQAAIAIGIRPSEDIIDTGKSILDSLSDWDADYLSEDGTELSDEAYRELLSALNERTNNGATPWVIGEHQLELVVDEDDEDGANWADVQFGVGHQGQPDTRTVLSMVYDHELVVNPEWQRNFVWPIKKQRRFIESILMGLPIPSLLLFEDPHTATKYVIDGRQRLETLAKFCATPEERERLPFLGKRFKTFSSNEPLWREGQDLNTAANKFYGQLPDLHRRKIDRAILTVFTFRALRPRQLYQIFQRYNTGAEKLRAAEIRNAVYQASELHQMLWRLAGESPDRIPFVDAEEEYVAKTLRNLMQNKTARYGAYDFIGRVLAFTYLDNGKTVAAATNDFMDQFETEDHRQIHDAFIEAFNSIIDWYTYPLSTPAQNGGFHNFLGTIQLATAHQALIAIKEGSLTEDAVKSAISKRWISFAQETLGLKQNSGNFWGQQKLWWQEIQSAGTGA